MDLKKGQQILNGNKAMQFVRFRKGYADQDLSRIRAPQLFLQSLTDKLFEPQTILKLPKIAKTFSAYVETNMPISEITNYAIKAMGINLDSIHMDTLPGTSKRINGVWYYISDAEKTQDIIVEFLSDLNDNNVKNTEIITSNGEIEISLSL